MRVLWHATVTWWLKLKTIYPIPSTTTIIIIVALLTTVFDSAKLKHSLLIEYITAVPSAGLKYNILLIYVIIRIIFISLVKRMIYIVVGNYNNCLFYSVCVCVWVCVCVSIGVFQVTVDRKPAAIAIIV